MTTRFPLFLTLFLAVAILGACSSEAQEPMDHESMDHDSMEHGEDHDMSQYHAGVPMDMPARGNDEARPSPNALVGQTIGTTNVFVSYSRPSVRDREIFGGLVPFGEVWRTGANEATVVHFSDNVKVAGQPLAAGSYGLFTIPGEDSWTVIFNTGSEQWGSFNHDPSMDRLRIDVEPRMGEQVEQMSFWFENVGDDSGMLVLAWDDVMVPIAIEVE